MKIRLLKKLLGNPEYIIQNSDDEAIHIGSPYLPEILKVSVPDLKIHAGKHMDIYDYGPGYTRRAIEENVPKNHIPPLLAIYDKLKELINSGGIKEVLEGNDDILPGYVSCYRCLEKSATIIKTYSEAFKYPNITIEGYLIHENDGYYKNEQDAIAKGIEDCNFWIKHHEDRVKEAEQTLAARQSELLQSKQNLASLQQKKSKSK